MPTATAKGRTNAATARAVRAPRSLTIMKKFAMQGMNSVIVTAATRYQVDPIARVLGIEDVCCTGLEVVDGKFTGETLAPLCYGDGKAMAVVVRPTDVRVDGGEPGRPRLLAEVAGGIRPSDQVVTSGQTKLTDGVAVRVRGGTGRGMSSEYLGHLHPPASVHGHARGRPGRPRAGGPRPARD